MGNILNVSPDQIEDSQNLVQLKIQLDLNRPVSPELKQLQYWSLQEIRNIYMPFRKRKSSPILTRSQFLRFLRLSRISAFHIYDQLCKKDLINAFEVVSILILTAFTTYSYKIQFMFNVFDLMSNKTLKFSDLILMFKSVVRGLAYLTDQPMPDIQVLEKYAHAIFSRADLNNDQNLELPEIMSWVEENKDAIELFKRFEPKIYGKQQYHIFSSFCSYKEEEVQILLARIKKVHNRQKLDNQDYMLLKMAKLPKTLTTAKQNSFGLTNPQLVSNLPLQPNKRLFRNRTSFQVKAQDCSLKSRSGQSIVFKDKINSLKLPFFSNNTNTMASSNYQLSSPMSKIKKMHFNNIIIIKGRTITKRQIFDLRDYFDKLSCGKQVIYIQDFIESFSQEKYNHMKSVAASLYNFLDHNQNGKVSFKELLMKIYPNLTMQHIICIDRWCDEYNANFNIKNKIKINKNQDQTKKRVLPKACLSRYKQMFSFYDKDNKGYIDLEDMKKVLGEVCPERQILELFQDSDKDQDGRLTLQEFANVILPLDLQIEGLQ